jgi:hypothetical protein
MTKCEVKTLIPYAARLKGSGLVTVGDAVDVGAWIEGLAFVTVATEIGSATLDVVIQISDDGVNFITPASNYTFTQITAAGRAFLPFTNFGKWIRAQGTLGGAQATDGFTYGVTFVAKTSG